MAGSGEDTQTDAQLNDVEFTPTEEDTTTVHHLSKMSVSGSSGAESSVSDGAEEIDVGERFCQDFDVQAKYKILGFGHSSKVFEATKKLDKKKYAIKRIERNSIEQSHLKEVQSLASLDHPGIVRYFNAWIEKGLIGKRQCLYIQLELCKSTLGDWLCENVNREKETVLNYFKQILIAVEHIHEKKLIHRDLKPTNIFFATNGTLKIGDFGLVTIHDVPEDQTGTDACDVEHSLKGTPSYMSPEQLERRHYDMKTDIYSLGLVFLEMCAVTNFKLKGQIFSDAKEGIFPAQNIFPRAQFINLLNLMLTRNPKQRLSASAILQHGIFPKTEKNKNKMTVNIKNMKAGNVMIGDGNVMHVGNTPNMQQGKIRKPATKPITVSQQQPSRDQLLDIKDRVGNDWRDLGRRLDFDEAILDQMQMDNHGNAAELIYQILLKWMQRDNEKATRSRLANIFMKLERGDLADFLSD